MSFIDMYHHDSIDLILIKDDDLIISIKSALLWLLNLQVITWTKWEIVRIFEINIIIIMVHVIFRVDFNKRKVNVMVVTL